MRVCILKETGEIIGAQSGGSGENHLKTLSDNAVLAEAPDNYDINDIEVFYETDAEFELRKIRLKEE